MMLPRDVVVMVLLALLLSGCPRSQGSAEQTGPRVGGRLVIGVHTEPRDLDQATQLAFVEGYVSTFLGSGLVTIAPDGRIVPVLARSWEQSSDGKRLTFHLRDDVRYASGRKLVAGDFAATFQRILAPATASPLRDLFEGVTSIRARDDATLSLALFLSTSQIGAGLNFSRYRNPAVDKLLRRARETTSEREHQDALAEVQRTFAQDAVWATIGYPTWGIAVRRSVRGARPHPLFPFLILDDAWLAEGVR